MPTSSVSAITPPDLTTGGHIVHDDPTVVTSVDIAIGVVIGRASEYFDVFVFAIASVIAFPQVFFPFVPEKTGMAYSFLVFVLAFVARPVGAAAFHQITDRFGRGTKLIVVMFAIGTFTAGIAFLPGYNKIGMAAVAWLAVFRFLQGAAIGGSWDGLPSLLQVSVPRGKRGTYAAIAQLGAPIGFVIAAAMFAFLWMSSSHADFIEWGWRYPFFMAIALNVVALFSRWIMASTPQYGELYKTRELSSAPVADLVRTQWRGMLLGGFAPLASFALIFLVTVFALAWASLTTSQSIGVFLLVQILGAFVAMAAMFVSGRLADRIGRRRTLLIGAVLIAVFSGWMTLLLMGSVAGGYIFVLVGFALLGFSHSQAAGAVNSVFPREYRYTGAAYTSYMTWLIGAAFAPIVTLELGLHLGMAYVGLYLLSGAIGTFLALRVNHSLETRAAEE